MELISVIVPIYNVEKYLDDCLKCIINQTYKNLEIILIDDGSIDSSGKICDEYAKKDKRIFVIHKENGGISSARNAGLKVANGMYVGFVDPDDFITCNMYEKLYKNLKKFNANISVCKLKKITDRQVRYVSNVNVSKPVTLNAVDSMRHMLSFEEGYSCGPCNKLYKKTFMKEFDSKFSNGEDLLFNFLIYFNDKNITVFDNEELYFYYYRNDSACHSPEFKPSYLLVLDIWDDIIEKISCSDTFKKTLPIAFISFRMVIWSTLFSLAYSKNNLNKKIFCNLKIKYKNILKTSNQYEDKSKLLRILYYLPYDTVSKLWRIYIKFKLFKN